MPNNEKGQDYDHGVATADIKRRLKVSYDLTDTALNRYFNQLFSSTTTGNFSFCDPSYARIGTTLYLETET